VCERDPPTCERIQLTRADITPLELNWQKLARAICKAFGLDTKIGDLPIPHTIQIGSWSADAVPVILTIQTDRHHLHFVISDLIARLHQKFILFAPTTRNLDASSQELLANANAAFFPLDTTVILTQNATLQPTKPPGELFAKFTPQPKESDEGVARSLFALAKALDTETGMRKAQPSTILRLYCAENLEPDQIARKLHCARSLIYSRLKFLSQKLGRDPAELRQYSTHLQNIENSLSDSRAKEIYRKGATQGDDGPDEPND
jgi:hypothetical protein